MNEWNEEEEVAVKLEPEPESEMIRMQEQDSGSLEESSVEEETLDNSPGNAEQFAATSGLSDIMDDLHIRSNEEGQTQAQAQASTQATAPASASIPE